MASPVSLLAVFSVLARLLACLLSCRRGGEMNLWQCGDRRLFELCRSFAICTCYRLLFILIVHFLWLFSSLTSDLYRWNILTALFLCHCMALDLAWVVVDWIVFLFMMMMSISCSFKPSIQFASTNNSRNYFTFCSFLSLQFESRGLLCHRNLTGSQISCVYSLSPQNTRKSQIFAEFCE